MHFESTSTLPSGQITGYEWDNYVDGSVDYTTVANQHPFSPGTHAIQLIVTTEFNCKDSVEQMVQVYHKPSADFILEHVCAGKDFHLENISQIVTGTLSYQWDIENDNTIDALTHHLDTHLVNYGTYDVRLLVTSDHGCMDSIVKRVVIYPNPVALFSTDSVCLLLPNTFTNESFVPDTTNNWMTRYTWDFGNQSQATVEHTQTTYTHADTFNVRLIVETNHGCIDSTRRFAKVYPLPFPDFSATESCLNDATVFTNETTFEATDDPDTYTYLWNMGSNQAIETAINPSFTYPNDGTFEVQLIATSIHNCLDSITKTIRVYPLPDLAFSASVHSECSPLCTQLSSQSTVNTPSTITSIEWFLDNLPLSDTDANALCIENTSSNLSYHSIGLKASTNHGCLSEIVYPNYLTVYDLPIADFEVDNEEVSIVYSLVNMKNNSYNADTYAWNFGDNTHSTLFEPSHLFPDQEDGNYRIQLIARTNYGCLDTAYRTVHVKEEMIFYIPNSFTPDGDMFNQEFKPVFTNGYDKYDYNLFIYNRWGELIFESHDSDYGWNGNYAGFISPQGTYSWKIVVGTKENDLRKSFTGHVNLIR